MAYHTVDKGCRFRVRGDICKRSKAVAISVTRANWKPGATRSWWHPRMRKV